MTGKIRRNPLERHKSRRRQQEYAIRKIVKVEIRVADHVTVIKMPGKVFMHFMESLTRKFEYDYFRDRSVPSGLFFYIPWRDREVPSDLGARLKYFREKENLTQAGLAVLIDSTQANVAAMERGLRPIGTKIAKRLGEAFEMDHRVFLQDV